MHPNKLNTLQDSKFEKINIHIFSLWFTARTAVSAHSDHSRSALAKWKGEIIKWGLDFANQPRKKASIAATTCAALDAIPKPSLEDRADWYLQKI